METFTILHVPVNVINLQNISAQELSSFGNVCRQMLMDMQERLVYRTYIYIRSDILQYSAAQGDLAYPEKLEMMQVQEQSVVISVLIKYKTLITIN